MTHRTTTGVVRSTTLSKMGLAVLGAAALTSAGVGVTAAMAGEGAGDLPLELPLDLPVDVPGDEVIEPADPLVPLLPDVVPDPAVVPPVQPVFPLDGDGCPACGMG